MFTVSTALCEYGNTTMPHSTHTQEMLKKRTTSTSYWKKIIVQVHSTFINKSSLSLLSSVFCCTAGSGYPNGYPVLGNSRGGFPLPSSRCVITYCDQSFPSPWHCLSTAPLPYPVLPSCPPSRAFPYPQPGDAGGRHNAPAVCQSLTSADPTN